MAEPIKRLLYADEGDTNCAPMAAAVGNRFAAEMNLDVVFESAGIYAKEGTPTDPLAVRALKELYNIDLPERTARPLTPEIHASCGLHRTMDKRLNAFYNDRALSWPTDGCFALAKPTGKSYEEYKIVAEYFYKHVKNQIIRLVEEGRIVEKAD